MNPFASFFSERLLALHVELFDRDGCRDGSVIIPLSAQSYHLAQSD